MLRACRRHSSKRRVGQQWAAAIPMCTGGSHSWKLECAKLVFLGCPGVGKGTYARMLCGRLRIPHIAMGDLVREELFKTTPEAHQLKRVVNQGQLASDDIVLKLLSNRLSKARESGESGFILDGFPRTRSQAVSLYWSETWRAMDVVCWRGGCDQLSLVVQEVLDQLTEINMVLNLRLREDVLILKCLGRRMCSGCGNSFNLANVDIQAKDGSPRILMPAILPPTACLSKLTVREDDTEEVIRERLRIYTQESKPVEDYYKHQHKLLDFDVAGGIPETWPKLLDALRLQAGDDRNPQHL